MPTRAYRWVLYRRLRGIVGPDARLEARPMMLNSALRADLLVTHADVLYSCAEGLPDLGRQEDGAVAFLEGEVVYVGPASHAPDADEVIDAAGLLALPGLVDPHTHAVFAGSRSDEFRRRLAGATYSEILESGGGILHTVAHTRAADLETLAASARARLDGFLRRGVTTVEVKSGYGLNVATELKMLEAAWECRDTVQVVPTFLGAHTIPAELRGDRDRYVRQIIEEQLPAVVEADLAVACDVYCDRGAFTLDESVAILSAARALGLGLRVHAEQVAYTGIAEAAARLGATSADHLERIDDAGIAAMAEHQTVAVLLPGAQLYLRDDPPPVAALRAAGGRLALGTDLNPGSSPIHDPWTIQTLATLLQGFTVEEAVLGMTRNAGLALGRSDLGWLGPGSAADLILVAPPPGEPAELSSVVQHMGGSRVVTVVRDGTVVLGG